MTAQRARDLTGEYWVRTFGGDDRRYARSAAPRSEVARLYLAVDPNGFVTPNINRSNLLNEYTWADTGEAVTASTLARIP